MKQQPIHVIWWLISRASGIVAVVLLSVCVLLGLMMATKLIGRPALKRLAISLHEHLALVALAAIAIHGLALMGDKWLNPGWKGIAVPFALSYRPAFTGVGIIAGYLAALLGPSFYLRRKIGAKRWRKLHRATTVAWILAAVHTIGAGSDGSAIWLRAIVFAPAIAIVYLVVLRVLPGDARARRSAHPAQTRAAEIDHSGRAHGHASGPTRAVRAVHSGSLPGR